MERLPHEKANIEATEQPTRTREHREQVVPVPTEHAPRFEPATFWSPLRRGEGIEQIRRKITAPKRERTPAPPKKTEDEMIATQDMTLRDQRMELLVENIILSKLWSIASIAYSFATGDTLTGIIVLYSFITGRLLQSQDSRLRGGRIESYNWRRILMNVVPLIIACSGLATPLLLIAAMSAFTLGRFAGPTFGKMATPFMEKYVFTPFERLSDAIFRKGKRGTSMRDLV